VTNNYVVVAELPPLIVGDSPNLVFMCQEDGALVADFEAHAQWHEAQRQAPARTAAENSLGERIVVCRCPDPDEPEPVYWFCSLHDKANRPRGEVLHGERETGVK
jgi:hypothetical protein